MKMEEKGSTKEKVDSMQKKYDVSIAINFVSHNQR